MIKRYLKSISLFALFATFFSPLYSNLSYSLSDCFGISFDAKLVKLMNFNNGTFIEVGANDGITQSNTKLLEEFYGWTGILVEPSEILFNRLCLNRPHSKCFQCALGSFDQDGTYVYGDFDGGLMSSIDGNRLHRQADKKVLMRSLQSILDEVGIKHINFLSLDTEGYELPILHGIDFEQTTFDFMLIEIYKHQYDAIVSFLAEKGYKMVSSFSYYNHLTNPQWDGMHNDYLFVRASLE